MIDRRCYLAYSAEIPGQSDHPEIPSRQGTRQRYDRLVCSCPMLSLHIGHQKGDGDPLGVRGVRELFWTMFADEWVPYIAPVGLLPLSQAQPAVTTQWYTSSEQTFVTSVWQSMFGVAGISSYLLAFGFYHIQSRPWGMAAWQLMTACIAVISFAASGKSLSCLIRR